MIHVTEGRDYFKVHVYSSTIKRTYLMSPCQSSSSRRPEAARPPLGFKRGVAYQKGTFCEEPTEC